MKSPNHSLYPNFFLPFESPSESLNSKSGFLPFFRNPN
ncbi:hypothetical protein SLEP1_g41113 [Rubroshorea leprosula]|uniref:Uncharacterized protein n=1 Tax=Rubroshorea leprosula TaxID=152421 RepID=A0AAV5L5H2_9ROSI|nr:hypothetical protein SLEP1_g41113 [Rubroshorea leprosula]